MALLSIEQLLPRIKKEYGLPLSSFMTELNKNKRSVVTIGGNRSLSVKVKDTDTSKIKALIVQMAFEK